MARRRKRPSLVIDTVAVIRGARALRQKPSAPDTPELLLILSWIEDEGAFDWLFSETILEEYREVLRRLKVPRNAAGRFINLLRDGELWSRWKGAVNTRPTRRMTPSTTARLRATGTTSSRVIPATSRP